MHTWSKLNYQVYKVSGADAETFLQGQISQDIHAVTPSQAQVAAFCNAKGRMFALLLLFRDSDKNIYLRINDSIAATVIKRLQMFVLRSKVKFEATDLLAYGLDVASFSDIFSNANTDAADLTCQLIDGGHAIRLPGMARFECYIDPANEAVVHEKLTTLAPQNPSAYLALDIQSGFYHIEPHTLETILPQTTPIEDWGGINYSKGCYVGQEIIARSHYRGSVKRKLMVAKINHQVTAGESIYEDDNAIGEVLMSSYNENSSPPYFISAIMSLGYENKPLLVDGKTVQFAGTDGGKS